MDNKRTTTIVGIGDVCLKMEIGQKLFLKDVRHVPSLLYNLVSIEKLADDWCRGMFGDNSWMLTKSSQLLARVDIYYNMYRLKLLRCTGPQTLNGGLRCV